MECHQVGHSTRWKELNKLKENIRKELKQETEKKETA